MIKGSFISGGVGSREFADNAKFYPHSPPIQRERLKSPVLYEISICSKCSGEMIYNVPRMGANGGFIHKDTHKLNCSE